MNKGRQASIYRLTGGNAPLSFVLSGRDSKSNPLLYYDQEMKSNRALRYAPNQRSPFMDEQDGQARLEHIVFDDGKLVVQPEQDVLKKFLALHPGNVVNGGTTFEMIDKKAEAKAEIDFLDMEDKARELASSMSIKDAENFMRTIKPSTVDFMTSEEIRRDVRVYARNFPMEFLEKVEDPKSELKSLVLKAISNKVIRMNGNKTEAFLTLQGKEEESIVKVPKGHDCEEAIMNYLLLDPKKFKEVEKVVSVL